MSLCRPARCGCSFVSSTLDITQTASGVVTIESPDAAASAYPLYTFLNVAELVATITVPVEGMEAWLRSTNQKVRYDGTGWRLIRQGSTAYTPTYVNLALGTGGLNSGRYWIVEDTCFVRTRFQLGTGAAVTGSIQVSLPPIGAITQGDTRVTGPVSFYDQSASRIYKGGSEVAGTNLVLYSPGSQSAYQANATQPFTWATSDELWLEIDYAHATYLA